MQYSVVEGHFAQDCTCAQKEYSCDTVDKLILAFIDIIHKRPQNSWFYKKGWSFMNVLHNFKWSLHGTSWYVSYMASAQNPSFVSMGLLISRSQCICMGTGSLFVYSFCCFCGKARPLRRKTICGSVNYSTCILQITKPCDKVMYDISDFMIN